MNDIDVEVHHSSGNIFADLEVADADDMLLKAKMVVELRRLTMDRGLTQTATAKLIGMAQPDLSRLLGGELRGCSVERLMRMLTAFDQDIQIVSRPNAAGRGHISFSSQSV